MMKTKRTLIIALVSSDALVLAAHKFAYTLYDTLTRYNDS